MRRRVLTAALAAAAALLTAASPAEARPVRLWSMDELTKAADLVVIGTVRASADAKNHTYPDAKPDTWVAVDTVFRVESVFKGDLKGGKLAVRHFRFFDRKAGFSIVNGPRLVEFNAEQPRRYLMFLKQVEGAYEPLTGRYDPVDSFFQLTNYDRALELPPSGKPANDQQ